MVANRSARREKMREELARLRNAALAELERRGYEVRGKTPAQIRKMLRRRPARQETNVGDAGQEQAEP